MDIKLFNICLLLGWLMILAGGVILHPGWGIAVAGAVLLVGTATAAYVFGVEGAKPPAVDPDETGQD